MTLTFDPPLCFIASATIGIADSIPENEFETRKNVGGYYLLSPYLFMTIFGIAVGCEFDFLHANTKYTRSTPHQKREIYM